MPRITRNEETVERITLSTSNVFNDQLKELSNFYMENRMLTFRMILREFVSNASMYNDFYEYYYNIYRFIKKDGVLSSSIQKTFYASPDIIAKFRRAVKNVGKEMPKETLVSEIARALISYFHKIKITDQRKKVKGMIEDLNKISRYKIKTHALTNSGLIVTYDLKAKIK